MEISNKIYKVVLTADGSFCEDRTKVVLFDVIWVLRIKFRCFLSNLETQSERVSIQKSLRTWYPSSFQILIWRKNQDLLNWTSMKSGQLVKYQKLILNKDMIMILAHLTMKAHGLAILFLISLVLTFCKLFSFPMRNPRDLIPLLFQVREKPIRMCFLRSIFRLRKTRMDCSGTPITNPK